MSMSLPGSPNPPALSRREEADLLDDIGRAVNDLAQSRAADFSASSVGDSLQEVVSFFDKLHEQMRDPKQEARPWHKTVMPFMNLLPQDSLIVGQGYHRHLAPIIFKIAEILREEGQQLRPAAINQVVNTLLNGSVGVELMFDVNLSQGQLQFAEDARLSQLAQKLIFEAEGLAGLVRSEAQTSLDGLLSRWSAINHYVKELDKRYGKFLIALTKVCHYVHSARENAIGEAVFPRFNRP